MADMRIRQIWPKIQARQGPAPTGNAGSFAVGRQAANEDWRKWSWQRNCLYRKCRFRNARPDPVFRYFSKSSAFES